MPVKWDRPLAYSPTYGALADLPRVISVTLRSVILSLESNLKDRPYFLFVI